VKDLNVLSPGPGCDGSAVRRSEVEVRQFLPRFAFALATMPSAGDQNLIRNALGMPEGKLRVTSTFGGSGRIVMAAKISVSDSGLAFPTPSSTGSDPSSPRAPTEPGWVFHQREHRAELTEADRAQQRGRGLVRVTLPFPMSIGRP
jgi:hypothetical protein